MLRYLLLLTLGAVLGCGQDGPTLAKVRGTVTYKNAPLKFGSVVFQPEKGKLASGKIQPDGTFELTTNTPGDGAVVGTHRIRVVSSSNQDPNVQNKGASGAELSTGKSLIPEKYTDLEKTPLKQEVQDIEVNTFKLDLVD
jgi:hypothetical protein